MGHRVSHFRSYFQKKKTIYMFRRWSFPIALKELLKNSNPLQSYGQNSNLSPSKPPYVHLGGLRYYPPIFPKEHSLTYYHLLKIYDSLHK